MSVKMPFKAMEYNKSEGTEFGKPTFVKYGKEIDIPIVVSSADFPAAGFIHSSFIYRD